MKITVTKEDIRKGKIGRQKSCPIALAILRSGLKFGWYGVDVDMVYLKGLDEIELPSKATKFIDLFDEGKIVKPFSFNLPIPNEGA